MNVIATLFVLAAVDGHIHTEKMPFDQMADCEAAKATIEAKPLNGVLVKAWCLPATVDQ